MPVIRQALWTHTDDPTAPAAAGFEDHGWKGGISADHGPPGFIRPLLLLPLLRILEKWLS